VKVVTLHNAILQYSCSELQENVHLYRIVYVAKWTWVYDKTKTLLQEIWSTFRLFDYLKLS